MKTALLTLILMCCASWVVAQSTGSSSDQSNDNMGQSSASGSTQAGSEGGMASGKAKGNTKITGCLSQENGNYALKDDETGTSYSLYGKQDLSKYVGQKIEVQGMQTSTSEQVASPSAQGVGQHASQNPFHVKSVKKAGGSCSGS